MVYQGQSVFRIPHGTTVILCDTKTAFLLIIFGNRKRWNGGIVNGTQTFLGIGRTGRVFHLFRLFHPREWNSWNSRNNWNSGDTFRWTLELYEYKNLGVLKNYIGSFSSNVTDNIEKTRKKAGMIFSSSFDRRKTNPLIFVKFCRQACLPSLLFGGELFSLTPSLLLKLERCQLWSLKNIFYLPSFAHSTLVLRISGLNSIESEIDVKRLLFLGRLITQPKMSVAVRSPVSKQN